MLNFFKFKNKQNSQIDQNSNLESKQKLNLYRELNKRFSFKFLKISALFLFIPGIIAYKTYIYYLKNDPQVLRK